MADETKVPNLAAYAAIAKKALELPTLEGSGDAEFIRRKEYPTPAEKAHDEQIKKLNLPPIQLPPMVDRMDFTEPPAPGRPGRIPPQVVPPENRWVSPVIAGDTPDHGLPATKAPPAPRGR